MSHILVVVIIVPYFNLFIQDFFHAMFLTEQVDLAGRRSCGIDIGPGRGVLGR